MGLDAAAFNVMCVYIQPSHSKLRAPSGDIYDGPLSAGDSCWVAQAVPVSAVKWTAACNWDRCTVRECSSLHANAELLKA